jgi:hypothetical protein
MTTRTTARRSSAELRPSPHLEVAHLYSRREPTTWTGGHPELRWCRHSRPRGRLDQARFPIWGAERRCRLSPTRRWRRGGTGHAPGGPCEAGWASPPRIQLTRFGRGDGQLTARSVGMLLTAFDLKIVTNCGGRRPNQSRHDAARPHPESGADRESAPAARHHEPQIRRVTAPSARQSSAGTITEQAGSHHGRTADR